MIYRENFFVCSEKTPAMLGKMFVCPEKKLRFLPPFAKNFGEKIITECGITAPSLSSSLRPWVKICDSDLHFLSIWHEEHIIQQLKA